jgi:hypothetical protein
MPAGGILSLDKPEGEHLAAYEWRLDLQSVCFLNQAFDIALALGTLLPGGTIRKSL